MRRINKYLPNWVKVHPMVRRLLKELVDAVNASGVTARGRGVRCVSDGRGTTISVSPPAANVVCRAKAQEGSQADGELSVKLLDFDNNVIGIAFDVYAFPDKGATDMTDYLPDIDTNDVLLVCKANDGNWYLVWPTLIKVGTKTSTISATADDIFGRVVYEFGSW